MRMCWYNNEERDCYTYMQYDKGGYMLKDGRRNSINYIHLFTFNSLDHT